MKSLRRLSLVIVCLLGLAALPQGAGAAVVGVSRDYLVAGNTGSTYTADRGEVNNLVATTERDASGTTWVVYDDIVPIRVNIAVDDPGADGGPGEVRPPPSERCEQPAPADPTVVRCTLDSRGDQEVITLGDGDDRLTWRNPAGFRFGDVFANGYTSDPRAPVPATDDDVLDVVDLASRNVVVHGGDGNDSIMGSVRLVRFVGEGSGDFYKHRTFLLQFEGDEGNDTITCQTPCTAKGDGSVRPALTEARVEGRGKDTLIGSPGRDYLNGSGGNDLIRGNGGDDQLCGGPGRDRIFGGPGNDLMSPGTHQSRRSGPVDDHDRLVGGPGRNRLWPSLIGRKPHQRLNLLIC